MRPPTAVAEGKGHECAIGIADTEEITMSQRPSERLPARNVLALVEQAIEGLLARWMGMDEDEAISLANHLQMHTRNDALVHDNVV